MLPIVETTIIQTQLQINAINAIKHAQLVLVHHRLNAHLVNLLSYSKTVVVCRVVYLATLLHQAYVIHVIPLAHHAPQLLVIAALNVLSLSI